MANIVPGSRSAQQQIANRRGNRLYFANPITLAEQALRYFPVHTLYRPEQSPTAAITILWASILLLILRSSSAGPVEASNPVHSFFQHCLFFTAGIAVSAVLIFRRHRLGASFSSCEPATWMVPYSQHIQTRTLLIVNHVLSYLNEACSPFWNCFKHLKHSISRMQASLFRPRLREGSQRLEWRCVSSNLLTHT